MSIATIIGNVATKGGQVSGIERSFAATATPDSVAASDLPALLHFSDGGTNDRKTHGGAMWLVEHKIKVTLLVCPKGSGNIGPTVSVILGLVDAYIAAMRGYDTAGGAARDLWVATYGAPGSLSWGGVDYHGCQFTLSAIEYVEPS